MLGLTRSKNAANTYTLALKTNNLTSSLTVPLTLIFVPILAELSIPSTAYAQSGNTQCEIVDSNGDSECVTSIQIAQFAPAYQSQQATEWCWAASIAMIWAFYGHPVSQAQIVTGEFGQLINQGGQPSQIFQALSGQRVDDNGVPFTSVVTGLYDYEDNYDNISYTDIGAALNNNEPVLIGTINPDGSGAHATVLSALTYAVPYGSQIEVLPDGSNILSATVFDPWPTSGGITTLSYPQYLPAGRGGALFFAAIAQVSSASQSASAGGSSGSKGGGGSMDIATLAALLVVVLSRKAPRSQERRPTLVSLLAREAPHRCL
jgi:hypothetical protein